MLQMIARLAISAPRRVILGALCITIAAAVFGVPVTSSLSNGGFRDPASESARAPAMLAEKFGLGDAQVVVAVNAGVILAALLFMRRMARTVSVRSTSLMTGSKNSCRYSFWVIVVMAKYMLPNPASRAAERNSATGMNGTQAEYCGSPTTHARSRSRGAPS